VKLVTLTDLENKFKKPLYCNRTEIIIVHL